MPFFVDGCPVVPLNALYDARWSSPIGSTVPRDLAWIAASAAFRMLSRTLSARPPSARSQGRVGDRGWASRAESVRDLDQQLHAADVINQVEIGVTSWSRRRMAQVP
jgi:hypothetical protein